jgi:hypothetical protein
VSPRKLSIEPPPVAGTAKPMHQKPVGPPPAPRQAEPVQRPRVFSAPIVETVDPFSEPFEEEELVLESFATLASIFGRRTPRVENGREPSISRMVQHALDASAPAAEDTPVQREVSRVAEPATDRESRPTIRLAVVNETAPIVDEPSLPAVASDLADEPILVIEDDAEQSAAPQPGARRESYRQLFTRLRHGT